MDTTDPEAFEDQLLVSLVDPNDPSRSLLTSNTPGAALFTWSGEQADFLPGQVSFNGQTVTLDLTSITEPGQGLLLFQLINRDKERTPNSGLITSTTRWMKQGGEKPIFERTTFLASAGSATDLTPLTATDEVEVILTRGGIGPHGRSLHRSIWTPRAIATPLNCKCAITGKPLAVRWWWCFPSYQKG